MIFTSEQVSDGHPDKICDQIADAVLTECLSQDKHSRVAIECLINGWNIVVAGELTTKARIGLDDIVRSVLKRIGLPNVGRYVIQNLISQQSPDIAQGVDTGGAGDQGIMFGYATDETPEFLPLPFVLATKALQSLRALHHPQLGADAKAQVSFNYDTNRIETFLISTQHADAFDRNDLFDVVAHVMVQTARAHQLNSDFEKLVNPTGRFVVGSSFGDTGLTGRKIIADTYGGMARHGGGAFSGKDPTKMDRSGAYMARKIARDIVIFGWAERCEIQISYAIGVPEPTSVFVQTFGTEHLSLAYIERYIHTFDLTPRGIIDRLDLLNVDYNQTSTYGHFGKADLPWEN